MARALPEIEKEIRALARDDQEHLLRALLEEIDGPADPGVEQAWLEEVKRRSIELDQGSITPVPAEQVFAKARAALRQ
jgi:putative addiction module component (TIGR02574 family)